MNALIIDDEPAVCRALDAMLSHYCPTVHVSGHAHHLDAAVDLIRDRQPELLFLDVVMPDGSGFDLLSRLPGFQGSVVFVTAHERFALEALRCEAADYLLKPVHAKQLIASVERAKRRLERPVSATTDASKQHLILRNEDAVHVVGVHDILHCKADGNYTHVFAANGTQVLVSKTLKHFEEALSGHGFFKVHRAHLLNLQAVVAFEKRDGGFACLRNGTKVPVASRKREAFLRALEEL